jgi:hypothetical protein
MIMFFLRHFEKNACGETDNMYSKERRFRFFMFFAGVLKNGFYVIIEKDRF